MRCATAFHKDSGKCKVLIFLRFWSFNSHALFILSVDEFGRLLWDSVETSQNCRRTKYTEHVSKKIRPSKRLELYIFQKDLVAIVLWKLVERNANGPSLCATTWWAAGSLLTLCSWGLISSPSLWQQVLHPQTTLNTPRGDVECWLQIRCEHLAPQFDYTHLLKISHDFNIFFQKRPFVHNFVCSHFFEGLFAILGECSQFCLRSS